jgi:hypothetical protein
MSYESFIKKFSIRCPDDVSDNFQTNTQKTEKVCACMETTIQEKWPNLDALEAALYQLDRAPRGEADFYHGAMRIAAPYCHVKS